MKASDITIKYYWHKNDDSQDYFEVTVKNRGYRFYKSNESKLSSVFRGENRFWRYVISDLSLYLGKITWSWDVINPEDCKEVWIYRYIRLEDDSPKFFRQFMTDLRQVCGRYEEF